MNASTSPTLAVNGHRRRDGRAWAWGITGAYIVFAALTLSMVGLAFSLRVDLVSEDYYQREIAHQQQIERQARTRALPAGVAWSVSRDGDAVVLRFPPGHFAAAPTGQVRLYRPDNATLDRTFGIALDAGGEQRLAADLAAGRWQVQIEWEADGQQYYSRADLEIAPEAGA